jgi:hypothetical protein
MVAFLVFWIWNICKGGMLSTCCDWRDSRPFKPSQIHENQYHIQI